MHHSRKLLAATVAAFAFFSAPAVKAETPPDTLIQAWAIDDIISLDPAEIFEFTASEIAGNSYEGLIGYDPQPSGMQMLFYVVTLIVIVTGMWIVSRQAPTIPSRVQSVGST